MSICRSISLSTGINSSKEINSNSVISSDGRNSYEIALRTEQEKKFPEDEIGTNK